MPAETVPTQFCDTAPLVEAWTAIDPFVRAAIEEQLDAPFARLSGALDATPVRRGVVVSLGAAAVGAARFYAAVTGLRFMAVDTCEALLVVGADVEIVVTTPPFLGADLFDIVAVLRPDILPGIVVAEGEHLMARAVAGVLAAALPLSMGEDGRFSALDDDGGPPFAQTRWRMLCLETHSDGVDAQVGEGVLCSILENGRPDMEGVHACQQSGYCHRLKVPIAALGNQHDRVVAAEDVRAGVFVFGACWSLIAPSDRDDGRNQLGARIMAGGRVAALVGHWRPTLRDAGSIDGLMRDLAEGICVGTALATHNFNDAALRTDHQFCLIGDPRVRLAPRPSVQVRSGYVASPSVPRPLAEALAANGFLDPSIRSAMADAIGAAGGPADDLIADALAGIAPRTDLSWLPFAAVAHREDTDHDCGHSARLASFGARFACVAEREGWGPRTLGLCRRCGIASDRDDALAITARFAGGTMAFAFSGEAADATRRLVVSGRPKAYRRVLPWPRSAEGTALDRIDPIDALFPGPNFVSALFVRAGRYSVFTMRRPG